MMDPAPSIPVEVGLAAAIVTLADQDPAILVTRMRTGSGEPALPSGPFDPLRHRTFEIGLRAWVTEQTHTRLGYVEQLYTFGDRGRHAEVGDRAPHVVSVGYLALTRLSADAQASLLPDDAGFRSWYAFFPWEDWRDGRPKLLDETVVPLLQRWAGLPASVERNRLSRRERVRMLFSEPGGRFDEESVLERYELLYESGLAAEARRDGREAAAQWNDPPVLGRAMAFDHRRILATAMGRLRAKLKYRPVVFELMPELFTLTDLQRTIEAISGRHLHKQNFRRLVETSAAVEPTGGVSRDTGGRPAALYRFRHEFLQDRAAPGFRF